MILTRGLLQQAANEIRTAEAVMFRTVGELKDAGVWSGADADRFQQEWNDLVRGRLLGAAATLEGTSLIVLV